MFKNNSSFNVLYTTSIPKTHAFFQALGLEIKQLADDKVVVGFGTFDLHFVLNTTEPFADYRYIAEPGKYGHGTIFYVETDSIELDQAMIEAGGGVLKSEVFENLWGCRELLFEDPNGYKFALYQQIEKQTT